MQEPGKAWGRGTVWSFAEMRVIEEHPELTKFELAELLPGRTPHAIGNVRSRASRMLREKPKVKEPGDYLETLSAYLVDDFECMEIWMKWNGYASHRELSRDMGASHLGIVTLVCTAKG